MAHGVDLKKIKPIIRRTYETHQKLYWEREGALEWLGVVVYCFNEFYCLCVWGGVSICVFVMLMVRWSGVEIDDLHALTPFMHWNCIIGLVSLL